MRSRTRFYVLVLMFVAIMVVPIIPSTPQVASNDARHVEASFVPKSILFDESHTANGSSLWAPGNASLFSWILSENGYSSDTNFNNSLDSGILSSYDILVIFFPMIALTPGEIVAVQNFVDNGGSLLLVGVNGDNTWQFKVTYLNQLSTVFGIEFNNDRFEDTVTSFPVHNLTHAVTSIWPRGDDLMMCTINVTGPSVAPVASAGHNLTVAKHFGLGRVVAVGGPAPFYIYRDRSFGHGNSHFRFSLNVIDWLAGNPKRDALIPEIAEITVGPGPSLTPTEVEEYTLFVGQYHDHTTHSDGSDPPEVMLDVGMKRGMDFMIMTDHSHVTSTYPEGISGGQAMKEIAEGHALDITITVGAELSSVHHTTGWPLTDNIWTSDQQTAIDEVHAQGGIAIFCHPTIGPTYAPTYEAFDSYGFDAIEVDNDGYFFGGGEDGLYRNFIGANDGHAEQLIGQTALGVFVKNPTGPQGRVSDDDLKEAVLNRRVLILSLRNSMVYGEELWVNRYFELKTNAETAVASAHSTIDSLKAAGNEVGLSELYLSAADSSLERWNVGKALRLAENATSSAAIGLNVGAVLPASLSSDSDFDVSVTLENNHTYPVRVNASAYIQRSMTLTPASDLVEAPSQGTGTTVLTGHSSSWGLVWNFINIHSFNTSEYLLPVLLRNTRIIDNVLHTVREVGGQYEIDVQCWLGRSSILLLTSVELVYDDGSGVTTTAMLQGFETFDLIIGPFAPGTQITLHVRIVTQAAEIFDLNDIVVNLPGGTTTTTTTTTTPTTTTTDTGTGPPQPPDIMLLLAAGGGIAVVVVIVIIVTKRR